VWAPLVSRQQTDSARQPISGAGAAAPRPASLRLGLQGQPLGGCGGRGRHRIAKRPGVDALGPHAARLGRPAPRAAALRRRAPPAAAAAPAAAATAAFPGGCECAALDAHAAQEGAVGHLRRSLVLPAAHRGPCLSSQAVRALATLPIICSHRVLLTAQIDRRACMGGGSTGGTDSMVNVPVVAELQRLDGLRLSHVGANALYGLHLQGHPLSTVVQPLSGDIWSACTYRMAQCGSTSVEWTQGSM